MKVLVTGATGFIGRHLCAMLDEEGTNVVRAVRRLVPTAVVVGNVDGQTGWSAALRSVDVVVHLAARAHILKETAEDPSAEFRKVNVEGTLNLAHQAVTAGVKRFIFISSIGVHGLLSERRPICFADELRPHDDYSASKVEAEQGLKQLCAESGMELVIIRPPLVYGPGAGANFLRLMKLAGSGIPLPLGSVQNDRSLVYVGNLCSLIFQCLKNPAAAGQAFLVSDGHDVTTPQLLSILAKLQGKRAALFPFPVSLLRLAGRLTGYSAEIERLCGSLQVDMCHTKNVLGWTPPFTLEQGLRETVEHYLTSQRE